MSRPLYTAAAARKLAAETRERIRQSDSHICADRQRLLCDALDSLADEQERRDNRAARRRYLTNQAIVGALAGLAAVGLGVILSAQFVICP